jgi:hypothetical protein
MDVEQKTGRGYHADMDKDQLANIRRDNLRKWMRERKLSNSDLASKIESGRAYVSNLFREDRYFGEKAARRIESMLRMPAGYLDAEGVSPATVSDWRTPDEIDPDTFALVPRVWLGVSGGVVIATPEVQLPPLAFRREWLQGRRVTSRDSLRLCRCTDNSMDPHLCDGDIMLVDTGQTVIKDGEIYAIRYGDEIRARRLFKTLDGIRIHADNADFPDEVVATGSEGFVVIGRKVWRGG